MIKIGKLADYALLIAQFMNNNQSNKKLYTNDEISRSTHIPVATVRKLLKKLVDAHIVKAYRGNSGGYKLSHSAQEISIAEVITAVEGPISITECALNKKSCDYFDRCDLKTNWMTINNFLVNTFSNISLAEMAETITENHLVNLNSSISFKALK